MQLNALVEYLHKFGMWFSILAAHRIAWGSLSKNDDWIPLLQDLIH